MPNNQVLAAFFLAATVIIYCAFATLIPSAGRVGLAPVKYSVQK